MSDSGNVAVEVAVIGAIATISVGLLTNWDKLFGSSEKPVAGEAVAAKLVDGDAGAGAASGYDAAQSADAPPVDISGTWGDGEGFTYQITQTGTEFTYTEHTLGQKVGHGAGTIMGNSMRYKFAADTGDNGQCESQVDVQNQVIAGTCTSGGESWQWRVTRVAH